LRIADCGLEDTLFQRRQNAIPAAAAGMANRSFWRRLNPQSAIRNPQLI
jgi:hypothetical protein